MHRGWHVRMLRCPVRVDSLAYVSNIGSTAYHFGCGFLGHVHRTLEAPSMLLLSYHFGLDDLR